MRSLVRAALPVAAVAAALVSGPAPAYADGVWVELNPTTIQVGFQVGIKASCGDKVNQATVESKAFGVVTLVPNNGYHIASATIPSNIRPGRYDVKLTCASQQTANTNLWVVGAMPTSTHGPHTGGGALADNGTMMISGGAAAAGLGMVMLLLARRRQAWSGR